MLLQDIRYSLRSLWHSRGFATVAILCLGFGIGANTTTFSILDGVLLKPFPYTDPERIVVLGVRNESGDEIDAMSYLDVRSYQDETKSFEAIGGFQGRSLTVSDGGDPERYSGGLVTANLFPLLGVQPVLGTGFTAGQDSQGGGGVVLLSYGVWKSRYNLDRSVIGRQVLINGVPTVIVGVMPEHFEFPNRNKLWLPMAPAAWKEARNLRSVFTFAKMKPGVTEAQALADTTGVASRLAAEFPDSNKDWTSRIFTLSEQFIPPDVTLVISLMMAAATLVLLVACSNVANLMIARASVRRREITVRSALGAGRGRIIRQLLTESVVLSLLSVPLGILIAQFGTRAIAAALPPDQVPYYITWAVDARSLAYTVAVAVTTAVLFGLLPALQATRANLHETLKEGTRGNSVRRSLVRSSLVVVQVTLALVALVGALLFVRTFGNLDGFNYGFDPKPLMTMRFFMPGTAYEGPDAKLRRVQDVVERIEALPGVQAAFASNLVPLSGGGGGGNIVVDGRPAPSARERENVNCIGVTPHLYKTLGITRIRGRDMTDAEGYSRAPVAVISEAMAARFWPDREPLGGRFQIDAYGADWFTVVGIAPDFKLYGVEPDNQGSDRPTIVAFVPYAYEQTINTGLTIRVAGAVDPSTITTSVRAALRAADPNLPMFNVRTMEENRKLTYWQYGLYGWIFGGISVVGLLLACVGVYGVLSYSVSQRTQEIGVRIALGAGRRQVLGLVVGHGLALSAIGVVVGLALSAAATPVMRQMFFQVSPFDPLTFITVPILFMAVAFLASLLPALRATRVDPVVALRGE
jgi:putative ABC transport system permease protein